MSDSLTFFRNLGALTSALWREAGLDERAFPDIAMEALVRMPPHAHVAPAELLRDFLLTDHPARQRPDAFGDPAILVYDAERFFIEVLHWVDGTTTIHEHGFCGAFHVLRGSSMHTCFRFNETQRINEGFALGTLTLESIDLLTQGDSQPIRGTELKHSLFHLDRPSVTVVVRTRQDHVRQMSYLPPYVAHNTWNRGLVEERRLAVLRHLIHSGAEELIPLLAEVVAHHDPHTAFLALKECYGHLAEDRLAEVVAAARASHGLQVDAWLPSLEELTWRTNITARREDVTDPRHRYFLALLLNVPERGLLLDFVERRAPGDPVETVLGWLRELMVIGEGGAVDLLGVEVTVEDTPHGEHLRGKLDEALLVVIRGLIEDRPRGVLQQQLAELSEGALDRAAADDVLTDWEPIRSSLLRPLFRT